VTDPETTNIEINGHPVRIWRKGSGPKLGFLAGVGGLPRWTPFLDKLSETRTVIVPSLPGFPGGGRGHTVLDSHLDWITAVRRILAASDLFGADIVGSSMGASLVAEVAALCPEVVHKIVLIAPFGIFDEAEPTTDIWAQLPDKVPGLLTADPEVYLALKARPDEADPVDWPIEQSRADEAGARIFWPLGDTRLAKRLDMISAPTLLIWGNADRVIPPSYAEKFKSLIGGPTDLCIIRDAGHLAELDKPDTVAETILRWLD
jgi:pimeloyl-ACP methyl ester carboxylesterase